ncbi:MAG TPA: hypothetical protein PKU69_00035 [Bacillota bacterium]|nr:hypothetical protein [Bacillota bacterium]
MANIGAGETYTGYIVRKTDIIFLDSLLKDTLTETERIVALETSLFAKKFRYRYFSMQEKLATPLRSWIKTQFETTILSSDTEFNPHPDDYIFLEGQFDPRLIINVINMREHGYFAFVKSAPYVLVLK